MQLQQAAELAGAGKYEAAMVIYRRVFGTHPPPGDLAVAYYETEAATVEGRAHAVAGLRALLDKDPGNAQYRVALGHALTYDPSTRRGGEGVSPELPERYEGSGGVAPVVSVGRREPGDGATNPCLPGDAQRPGACRRVAIGGGK